MNTSLSLRIRERIAAILIVNAVPFLNHFRPEDSGWRKPLEELRRYPSNTWGFQTAEFLKRHSFHVFLPKYELHDAMHVLLGYEVSAADELRLQAFMVGNRNASFAGKVLVILGAFLLPETLPTLHKEFKRGRSSPSLRKWPVQELLNRPLIELQNKLST